MLDLMLVKLSLVQLWGNNVTRGILQNGKNEKDNTDKLDVVQRKATRAVGTKFERPVFSNSYAKRT